MDGYLRFLDDDQHGVYHRLHRQVTETIRHRIGRDQSYVRIECDGDNTFDEIAQAVLSKDFRPTAIILSPLPLAGVEGCIQGSAFRVFCSEKGGNDALVLSLAVKSGLREVWDDLFVPLIPVYGR